MSFLATKKKLETAGEVKGESSVFSGTIPCVESMWWKLGDNRTLYGGGVKGNWMDSWMKLSSYMVSSYVKRCNCSSEFKPW